MANYTEGYDPYIPPQSAGGAEGAGEGAGSAGAAPGNQRTAALQAVSSSFIWPRRDYERHTWREPESWNQLLERGPTINYERRL